jgi:hypothetical protein
MTLTFLDLYNECAGQPWSMFDADAEGADDLESALKTSINKAISFLWNYQPWEFRIRRTSIKTKAQRPNYTIPNGLIFKKTLNNTEKYAISYNGNFLDYASNYDVLEQREGEPESFYLENDVLYIYPTPDNVYTLNVKYLLQPYGMNADDDEIYELKEEDDYVNIPEKYEAIFKNCLISLAMLYAIADESDENYSGYFKQYEDALNVLTKYCRNSIVDRNIVW